MLRAGFAKLDITPPFGTGIAGYFSERRVKGVRDPLYLCCLALEVGGERMLVITADFLGIHRARCIEMAAAIEARTGVPAASVIIHALHPHTSPRITEKEGLNYTYQGTYSDMVTLKMGDVAEMALADLDEALLFVGEEEVAEKISFVRRYRMKDGTVATNPGYMRAAEILGPLDEPDNTVHLLRFRRAKGDIAFVNFACHPDVIGGELVSADWPGFVRRFVEEDHPGVSCIFCNGFQGDSNHCPFMSGIKKSGYEHSAHMGRVVADGVNTLWEKAAPVEVASIGVKTDTVYTRTRTDELERYDELKTWYDAYNAGELSYKPTGEEIARASRVVNLLEAPIFNPIPVTVAHIGEVMLVGVGGEPFTYYIRESKALCPEKTVFTLCLVGGCEGYFPTAKAFEEGGYEAAYSSFTPKVEGELLSAIGRMLSEQA